mgnify:CR=1 FL=1
MCLSPARSAGCWPPPGGSVSAACASRSSALRCCCQPPDCDALKIRGFDREVSLHYNLAQALERLDRLEEAKRRDHRKLGRELDLFSIADEAGSGLVLWHPRGGFIRKQIEDYWRDEHIAGGYDIVYSPHIAKVDLWQTSGHLDFYKENMYIIGDDEDNEFVLKPMNCPFHILMYKNSLRSYRDLPLRYAEWGTVYRYERTGVLHGLFRVRGFTQDDAHVFCTPSQLLDEMLGFGQRQLGIAGQPESAHAINQAKVDRFGEAALVVGHFFDRNVVDRRCRCPVNVLILAVRMEDRIFMVARDSRGGTAWTMHEMNTMQ